MYYSPGARKHRYFREELQAVFSNACPINRTHISYCRDDGTWVVEELWWAMEAASMGGVCSLVPAGTTRGIAEYNWHQFVRACYHDSHTCTDECAPGYAPGTRAPHKGEV